MALQVPPRPPGTLASTDQGASLLHASRRGPGFRSRRATSWEGLGEWATPPYGEAASGGRPPIARSRDSPVGPAVLPGQAERRLVRVSLQGRVVPGHGGDHARVRPAVSGRGRQGPGRVSESQDPLPDERSHRPRMVAGPDARQAPRSLLAFGGGGPDARQGRGG